MAGFLFIIFAVSNSSYDSIQINIKNYKEGNCICEGKAQLRGKSYLKLEHIIILKCNKNENNCSPIFNTNPIQGLISYFKDETHGKYLWRLTIGKFQHPKSYFQKTGFIGISSTDSLKISNSSAISITVNIS